MLARHGTVISLIYTVQWFRLSTKDGWGHFNFMNSRFHLRELTIITSWIHVSTYGIQEFTISTSRIRDLRFMNSWFHLHKFTILISRIQFREYTISISRVKTVYSRRWNLNSWSWNREFMKLKSWIREIEMSLPVFRNYLLWVLVPSDVSVENTPPTPSSPCPYYVCLVNASVFFSAPK
jgi:hypothetical protein